KTRFEHQSVLLRALSGPLAGPEPVTGASFSSAAEPLLPLYPNLRAVVWARRMAERDVPLLERAMRLAGHTSFTVRNAQNPELEPGADRF
ncbi:hypothetical protein ABTF40_19035, partial [Acinetobacter baumannii]